MAKTYISLGSNMGDRKKYLKQALEMMNKLDDIRVVKVSRLYETAPVGKTDQNWFLNAVVQLETSLSPEALLKVLQNIEHALDRKRDIRWGPRTIDLDIIAYGQIERTGPLLTIPHPRAHQRAFVLMPLSDIEPSFSFPNGEKVSSLLATLENSEQKVLFFGTIDGMM